MATDINIQVDSPDVLPEDALQIIIAKDLLTAWVIFRLSEQELQAIDREELKREILYRLRQQRVSFGLDTSELDENLVGGKRYTLAKALLPVHGQNAVIRMIPRPEAKPEINDDGSVDYYNISLMQPIAEGDWLGEKEPATTGSDGMDITGKTLRGNDGSDMPFSYDKESVAEIVEDDLVVLRSLRDGMLHFQGDQVFILSHHYYDDIDFSTGNIYFDGSVTVRGTVQDGFMVRASGDISILGDMGIGAVSLIESTGGSIFIKGGVAGLLKAEVRAAHNIYTKFVLDSTLECGEKINIGFFSRNAILRAEEITVESSRGRIQGGKVFAGILVTANQIGSEMEARTELTISGFDREQLSERFLSSTAERDECRREIARIQSLMSNLGTRRDLDATMRNRMKIKLRDSLMQMQARNKILENTLRSLQRYLRMPNDGEIRIQRINRNCVFTHNGISYEIYERQFGKRYLCINGELVEKQM